MIRYCVLLLTLLIASTSAQASECEAPGKWIESACVFELKPDLFLQIHQRAPGSEEYFLSQSNTRAPDKSRAVMVEVYDEKSKTLSLQTGKLVANSYVFDSKARRLSTVWHASSRSTYRSYYQLNKNHLKLLETTKLSSVECSHAEHCEHRFEMIFEAAAKKRAKQ